MRLEILAIAGLSVSALSQCEFAFSNGFPVTNSDCKYLCDTVDSPTASLAFSEICHFQTYELSADEVLLPSNSCFSHYVIGMADAAFPQQSGYVHHWTPSPNHCQMLCQAEQDCVNFVWLWHGTGGTCFLKDAAMINNDEVQRFVHYDEYAVTGPAFCTGLTVLYGRGTSGLEGGRRWREVMEAFGVAEEAGELGFDDIAESVVYRTIAASAESSKADGGETYTIEEVSEGQDENDRDLDTL